MAAISTGPYASGFLCLPLRSTTISVAAGLRPFSTMAPARQHQASSTDDPATGLLHSTVFRLGNLPFAAASYASGQSVSKITADTRSDRSP